MIVNKRQLKENQIIDAAEKVFFTTGFVSAKMDQVAKAVDMSKGSLYFYFKSKDELYMAITYRAFTTLIDLYYEIIDQNKALDGYNRTIAIMEGYLDFSQRYFHYHEALFNYMSMVRSDDQNQPYAKLSGDVKDSIYFKKIQGIHNLPVEIVVKEIKEGLEDGSINNDQQPEMIYLTAWALISGFIKLNMYGGTSRKSIYHVELQAWKEYIVKVAGRILNGF